MPYHYTYYSYEEFGRGYIGSRTCRCNPEQDITYFGSYTDKNFHPTQKVILEVHNTSQESLEAENKLMQFYDVKDNPHFANKQFSPYRPVTNKGRKRHAEETRKCKESLIAYYKKPENREKLRRQCSGKNNPMFGKTAWNKGLSGEMTGKGRKHTAEHTEKVAAAHRGMKRSEETKRRIRESRSKGDFTIHTPEGKVFHSNNLTLSAEQNKVTRHFLYYVLKKCAEHKGWRVINNKKD